MTLIPIPEPKGRPFISLPRWYHEYDCPKCGKRVAMRCSKLDIYCPECETWYKEGTDEQDPKKD